MEGSGDERLPGMGWGPLTPGGEIKFLTEAALGGGGPSEEGQMFHVTGCIPGPALSRLHSRPNGHHDRRPSNDPELAPA